MAAQGNAWLDHLLTALLPAGGTVAALYNIYLDESGTHDGSKVLALGGYLAHSDAAREMSLDWNSVLRQYGLPYFHMVDCAGGSGVFAHLTKSDRIAVATIMIDLIKVYTSGGFAAITPPHRVNLEGHNAYTYCVQTCMNAMLSMDDAADPECKIALFLESGHESASLANSEIERIRKIENSAAHKKLISHSFVGKADICLLQAADILVWQCAKYVKDKLSKARPPRADYVSLMKHPTWFMHIAVNENNYFQSPDLCPHLEHEGRDDLISKWYGSERLFVSDDQLGRVEF